MKLKNVEIRNFRSIEYLNLPVEKDTKIFLGLSGTGKTNILKALSTLNMETKISFNDIRESTTSNEESSVEFSFELSPEDKTAILTNIKSCCYDVDLNNIVVSDDAVLNIDYFLNRDYFYYVRIDTDEKFFRGFAFKEERYSIPDKYKKVNVTKGMVVNIISVEEPKKIIQLKETSIINLEKFSCTNTNVMEDLTAEIFNNFINDKVTEYMEKNSMNVLFWKYDDKYLLPSEINTVEFVNNPEICLPLKKIFELCGYNDIKKEYDFRKSTKRSHSFDNLLEELSEKVSLYLRKKWGGREIPTQVVITESGDKIRIAMKDIKNKLEMSDKSDGFKRFISFLLMVSIDNTQNKLKDTLILVDCPEAEIDIPGQKYLRDELIEIGKNNYVFYTTHSSHMIDEKKIHRHYITKLTNEITQISVADESNYCDSAVLLNALGTAVFENVSNINLVFEGWTDKLLYNTGLELLKKTDSNKLKKINICHLGGLRNLSSFCSVWQIACVSKKFVIVADSDNPGKNSKKVFEESHFNSDYGWIMYGTLESAPYIIKTAEDYLKSDYIKKICDNYSREKGTDIVIDENLLNGNSNANMEVIETWIKSIYSDSDEVRLAKNNIKESLFSNVTKNNIKEEYKIFLEKLIEMLEL